MGTSCDIVTKGQCNQKSKKANPSTKGKETKGLNVYIRQNHEIEIELRLPNWAGTLSLTINGKTKDAKPFLMMHTTIM